MTCACGQNGTSPEKVLVPFCELYLTDRAAIVQLAKLAGVSEAGLDHFYKVLRVTAQWELIDETPEGKLFSPNASTRELVRGKEASLGHFVDHQVCWI